MAPKSMQVNTSLHKQMSLEIVTKSVESQYFEVTFISKYPNEILSVWWAEKKSKGKDAEIEYHHSFNLK